MLAALFVAAALSYTDRFILNILLPAIQSDLSLTDVDASFVQGLAFALIYGTAAIPLGALADRGHSRRIISVGIITWSIGTTACAFAHNFPELFGARVVVGLGEACLMPAAASMIAEEIPQSRQGFALGLLMMGTAIGGGLSVYAGGVLLDLFGRLPALRIVPWRATLAALGLAGLCFAVFFRWAVRRFRHRGTTLARAHLGQWSEARAFLHGKGRMLTVALGATALLVMTDVRRFGLVSYVIDTSLRAKADPHRRDGGNGCADRRRNRRSAGGRGDRLGCNAIRRTRSISSGRFWSSGGASYVCLRKSEHGRGKPDNLCTLCLRDEFRCKRRDS